MRAMGTRPRNVTPERIPDELELARSLIENGELEEAQSVLDAVLIAGPKGDDAVDTYYLRGEVLLSLGEFALALMSYDAAIAMAPRDSACLAGKGDALFALWQFDRARLSYEHAVRADSKSGRAHRGLALCLDRLGRQKLAEMHFERAAKVDPENYPMPARVDRETFDRLAREAVESLPKEITEKLGPIGFLVEDYPTLAMLGERPEEEDPETLGVFFGEDMRSRYETSGNRFVPNHIHLFQRNLEQFVATREELEEEIRTTVYHEVGHYLGYDEDGLDELGLA
jgi:predicted Zn-dependent protease with MMP-like domain